jgi:probable HAF family extracellular repeat protein
VSGAASALLGQTYSAIDLGALHGFPTSGATGINNSGQVVGLSPAATGRTHAFLYSSGIGRKKQSLRELEARKFARYGTTDSLAFSGNRTRLR